MPSSITVAHQVWFPSLPPLQLVRKICVSIHSCLQLPPLIIFPYCTGKGPWPDICKGADAVYFCCPWRDHLTISYRDFTTEFTVKIKKKKKRKKRKEGRKQRRKEGRKDSNKTNGEVDIDLSWLQRIVIKSVITAPVMQFWASAEHILYLVYCAMPK